MTIKESLTLKPGDLVTFKKYPKGMEGSSGFTIGKVYRVSETYRHHYSNSMPKMTDNTVWVEFDDDGNTDNGWQAACFERSTDVEILLFGDNNG